MFVPYWIAFRAVKWEHTLSVPNVPGPNADLSSTASVILMTVPSTSTCDFAGKREDFLYTRYFDNPETLLQYGIIFQSASLVLVLYQRKDLRSVTTERDTYHTNITNNKIFY